MLLKVAKIILKSKIDFGISIGEKNKKSSLKKKLSALMIMFPTEVASSLLPKCNSSVSKSLKNLRIVILDTRN